jgi:hypothetical protein
MRSTVQFPDQHQQGNIGGTTDPAAGERPKRLSQYWHSPFSRQLPGNSTLL